MLQYMTHNFKILFLIINLGIYPYSKQGTATLHNLKVFNSIYIKETSRLLSI